MQKFSGETFGYVTHLIVVAKNLILVVAER